MRDTPAIDVGAVGATEIHQPKFAVSLRVDHRMTARNFVIGQHDGITRRAPERTIALDGHFLAGARVEPGFRCGVHGEESSRSVKKCKYLIARSG